MTDPTRWTVDDNGDPLWGTDTWAITFEDLAWQLWTGLDEDDVRAAHAALVQCVRDADRLQQARELAAEARRKQYGIDRLKATTVLLDFLVDGGTDG